jgi:hypothetical protein
MIPIKHAPDLIRGGYRFSEKIMFDQWRVFQEQFHEDAILQSSMPAIDLRCSPVGGRG